MQEATIIKDHSETSTSESKQHESTHSHLKSPKKPRTGRGFAITAFILSIFTLLLTFINSILVLTVANHLENTNLSSSYTFSQDANSANFTEGSIADVANFVSDSVVSIITETKSTSYNFFYGETESTGAAAGTGIIVSSDGYVLTNKHVIDSATSIWVVLNDGTIYSKVKLIATDPLNDVAFLKIPDVSDLSAATLGDSKTITIGQQVIAIGNALGQYQNSVTSGIVSGTGRSLTATDSSYQKSETLTDMIQTDAAINSGNSGGPLVNAAGEVIGINTAVSEGNGIGFAIPISSVKGMLNSLLSSGEAKRAYIGIQYTNIDSATAIENDLSVDYGAYVSKIISGSPADSAGIKKGDIVLAIDGIKIGANRSLSTLLGEHSVGDTISVTLLRGESEKTLNLTLSEYSE